MRQALRGEGSALLAPSLGTWHAAVQLGSPVEEGTLLGTLVQAGRDVPVHAPAGVGGVVTQLAPSRTWLNGGDALLQIGAGGALGDALVVVAADRGDAPEGAFLVRSETDGTVYLRAEPSAPSFVAEGDVVPARATLALVEVMKTFSPVKAEQGGRVVKVLVSDAASVAEGDVLMWLMPL